MSGIIYTMSFFRSKGCFLDSGSFTPVHKKAYTAMRRVLREQMISRIGNPASAHQQGRKAQAYVDAARNSIARQNQIKSGNVLWTSGATEANFVAIRTAILHALRQGMQARDIHSVIGHEEHSSVRKIVSYFQAFGVAHTVAVPERGKQFTPQDVARLIRKNTVCLSLQYVNSTHGTIQPIAQIADACRKVQPSLFIHTDAAQATAYFNCSPGTLRADAVSVDSAKSFGPQGVGALLFRKAAHYSGLEGKHALSDMRPGTPPVALLHGFAVAFGETCDRREENAHHVRHIRDMLVRQCAQQVPDVYIHGAEKTAATVKPGNLDRCAPHLLYLSFPNTNHRYLATLLDTDGFSVSTSAACAEQTEDALRVGLLPTTTVRDITAFVRCARKHLPIAVKG